MAEKVKAACERELWDGEWYLRGITAKGLKIGSHENEEGKVFIESNTWAVVSDAASPERGRTAMDAVDKYLYSDYGIHLLWPAFSKPNDDIGFVGRVYKGIKENAAIFSHPNPWAVIAECKLGRGERAMKFYDSLLPYNQNDKIEVREAEPYSYCQFVMGKDHTAFGRARHPWLTGSGGWNYTAVTRWILGVRLTFDGLVIDPCVPADWKQLRGHAAVARRHLPHCGRESRRCGEGRQVGNAERNARDHADCRAASWFHECHHRDHGLKLCHHSALKGHGFSRAETSPINIGL